MSKLQYFHFVSEKGKEKAATLKDLSVNDVKSIIGKLAKGP